MRRSSRRLRVAVAAVVLAGAGIAVGLTVASSGPAMITVSAHFPETPGLYPGNAVDVLGLPVGNVTSIVPGPDYVTVRMQIERSVQLPAGVGAFLMAPNVVNDRYVQLDPAYTSGPVLADGAVIPEARTEVPVTIDQIIGSIDSLARALGPQGANASGALSQLLHSAATEFANQGGAIHQTISSFGQALSAFSSNSGDLTSLIDNLGNLTHAAASASSEYQTFAGELAAVSTALNGDSSSLTAALVSLQQALGQVNQFVRTNAANLGASLPNLEKVAGAIGQQQQQLAQLLSVAPLALQNLSAAFDPNPAGGGGPALRGRLDILPGSTTFTTQLCGNSVLRLLLLAVDQSQDRIPTIDLACGVVGSLETLPAPPGGAGPNLTLSGLLAAGR